MENPDQPVESKNPEYAGFWKRFAAMVIDGAIIMFVTACFKWMFIDDIISQAGESEEYYFDASDTTKLYELIADWAWIIYLIVLRWCYFAGLESSPLKATIGKLAVGLYVIKESGERIDFSTATGRHFAKIISGIILGIGYFQAGFSDKKQALHDTMSKCLVMAK